MGAMHLPVAVGRRARANQIARQTALIPCQRHVIGRPFSVRSTAAFRGYREKISIGNGSGLHRYLDYVPAALLCSAALASTSTGAGSTSRKRQAASRVEVGRRQELLLARVIAPPALVRHRFFIAAVSLRRRALFCTLVGLAPGGQMLGQRRMVQVPRGSIARIISGVRVDLGVLAD